jgi:uncharacterized membrane-anchored protein YjiN (DUF445 family)
MGNRRHLSRMAEPVRFPDTARGLPELPAVRQEAEKIAALNQMKARATGLLVVAAAVFVAALSWGPTYPWLEWVRAASEAAMVGGLADWFAVTALFRHPLGLPIPHTAIIPTRQRRIANILADFFTRNFLTTEVVEARLRELDLSRRVGEFLADPVRSERFARQVVHAARLGADAVPDAAVADFLDRSIAGGLRSVPAAPVAAKAVVSLTAGDTHQALLGEVLGVLRQLLVQNDEFIRKRIAAEAPWWVPNSAEEKLHKRVVDAIDRSLGEIAADREHPVRQQFDAVLESFVFRLQQSPETIAKAEQIKADLLAHPAVQGLGASLWRDAKAAIGRMDEADDAPHALSRAIRTVGDRLVQDEALRQRLDHAVAEAVAEFATRHRERVATMIEETVARWDGAETARRLELQVGRDLQYVRINGTIVGGLVGLVLHAIRVVF